MFPPCIDSSNDSENLSDLVHFSTARLDHLVSKDNEFGIFYVRKKQYGRDILGKTGTSLERARALNNGLKNKFNNLDQEFKTWFINIVSPSKIDTKRQHSFLSPIRKKKICSGESHSTKDMQQFQRVGWAHAKKKTIDKKTKFSMQEQRNVHETIGPVKHHLSCNTCISIWYFNLLYVRLQVILVFFYLYCWLECNNNSILSLLLQSRSPHLTWDLLMFDIVSFNYLLTILFRITQVFYIRKIVNTCKL